MELILAFLLVQGCQQYSDRDTELLWAYGGNYVQSGVAWAHYQAPVGLVHLGDHELTDAEFAAVFPAVEQMDPMVLLLRGNHTISDKSVKLLNRLRAVEHLDVSGTNLTVNGLRALRLRYLRDLIVSPQRITEAEADILRTQFPKAAVTRWDPVVVAPPS